ncbi:MAG: hypothetical protein FWH27_18985, partial [Planctomycetaceae bacterium]|nr:hypothetical protein [Planctomycetaceae bacterium]
MIESTITGDHGRTVWNMSLFFEGDHLRADVDRNGATDVICLDCYSKYTRLTYTTNKPSEGHGKAALTFTDGHASPSVLDFIPDPRWIGFLPLHFYDTSHLSPGFIFGSKLELYEGGFVVESDTVSQVPCWKISFYPPFKNKYAHYIIWVQQSFPDRLMRIENHFGGRFVDSVTIEGDVYAGDVWYPKSVFYERRDGDIVTDKSETRIKVTSLNEPLPRDTFSPKGISFLKPDTPVAWHLDRDRPVPSGELVWDG